MKRYLSIILFAMTSIAVYSYTPKDSIPTAFSDTEEDGVILHETFDQCNGTGGNDNKWSGNIASSTFRSDLEGWSCTKSYGGNHCARFGTGTCIIDAPAFYYKGNLTATFRVAPWATSKDKSIDLYFNDEILDVYELETGKWTDITISVQGNGNNQFEIISGGRLFIDDLKITPTNINAIRDITKNAPEEEKIYSIDGKYLGHDRTLLPKGLYIINHKKVIIPHADHY